ncbi:hypothetical protein, partial [Saccharicrinis sp. GN24d3]
MITKKVFLCATVLFFLSNHVLFSQENKPQKHYFGVNAGIDPANLIKIALESAFNSDDDDLYENEEDKNYFGVLILGVYYKYKPFGKLDFDAGYKLCASSLEDLNRSDNNYNYQYQSGADHLLYSRMNYNIRNIHQEGEGHLSSSFEIGSLWTPGILKLQDRQTQNSETIKIRGANLFYEFKLGYKYGLQNGAIGFNIGINNAPYQQAVLKDIEKRGFNSEITGGPGIV